MKIGDRVRIKESLAGMGFDYSEGQMVELNESNFEHLEGLMRGGSAEAETFQDTTTTNREANESIDLHTDDGSGPEPESDTELVKAKRPRVRRSDGDKG